MISGFITFSSKLPSAPPMLMATSLPMTWLATIVIASLWVGLTLPGMIELPGSFSGIDDLAQAAPRARGHPAHVVGDLHQRGRQRLECTVGEQKGVVSRERLELVGGRDKRVAREPGQLGRHAHGKLGVSIQPRADGRASQRQLAQVRNRLFDMR